MSLESEQVAAVLPSYEVGEIIGRGGWGVVLEGRHRQLGRDVAIKQLAFGLAGDPATRSRFVSEARLLASFDHPHIVPIYDYVEQEGLCLLVMEKLAGGTVWNRFTTAGLTMQSSCAVILATCSGLHFAHRHGVLHRDIKPENLLFSAQGSVKVTDFGIAKVVGGSQTLATKTGEVLGTPTYMAPEQIQGGEPVPATDVYATGVVLYELLTGRLPFPQVENSVAILYQHVYEQPMPLSQAAPEVPARVAQVTMKALATAVPDRFQGADEFGAALAEAAASEWGPGWMTGVDAPVLASEIDGVGLTHPAAPPAPPTVPGAAPEAAGPAPPTVAASAPVRPATAARPEQPQIIDFSRVELVPVRTLVKPPPAPRIQIAVALVLFAAMAVAALAGVGNPDRSKEVASGAITVAGADVSTGRVVGLDLTKPLAVAGVAPRTGNGLVKISFSAAELPLGSAEATVKVPPGGRFAVSVDPGPTRYFVAGRVEGEITVSVGGPVVAHQAFPVKSLKSSFTTIPGGGSIAVLLFVLAYVESLLRAMRRGRSRRVGVVGMTVLGAILGGVAVTLAGVFAVTEAVRTTAYVCAALGAGSGLASALAAVRVGKRRRRRGVTRYRVVTAGS